MNNKHREYNWTMVEGLAAKSSNDPIEELMASVTQPSAEPLSEPIRDAVAEALKKLGERERFAIDAIYVWGRSYADISDMMGYASKASAHALVKQASQKLKAILGADNRIIRLMENKVNKLKYETWQDASWNAVRAVDRCAVVGAFMPEVFDTLFYNLGLLVRSHGSETEIEELCWAVGAEAARGLEVIGEWDMEKMQDTLCRKQHDYGHENINAFGIVGVAVRLSDKIARYRNLTNKPHAVKDESVLDTLIDMVGYAVLAKMLMEGSFQLELEDPF